MGVSSAEYNEKQSWCFTAVVKLCRDGDNNAEVAVDGERHRVAARRQEETETNENVQEIQVRTFFTIVVPDCFPYLCIYFIARAWAELKGPRGPWPPKLGRKLLLGEVV